MVKTQWTKDKDVQRKWYLIDAKDKILGRLATKIANLLNGKGKRNFVPNVDCGDYVVVINAKYIKVTGKKMEDKKYYRHSTQPGKLKTQTLKEKLIKKPEDVIYLAVKNMMQSGALGNKKLKKLKVYAESEHSHSAQRPEVIDI